MAFLHGSWSGFGVAGSFLGKQLFPLSFLTFRNDKAVLTPLIVADESHHCCAIFKFNDVLWAVLGNTGNILGGASALPNVPEGDVAHADRLGPVSEETQDPVIAGVYAQ